MAQKRPSKKERGREAGIAPEDLAGFHWDKDEPWLWEARRKAEENPDEGILDDPFVTVTEPQERRKAREVEQWQKSVYFARAALKAGETLIGGLSLFDVSGRTAALADRILQMTRFCICDAVYADIGETVFWAAVIRELEVTQNPMAAGFTDALAALLQKDETEGFREGCFGEPPKSEKHALRRALRAAGIHCDEEPIDWDQTDEDRELPELDAETLKALRAKQRELTTRFQSFRELNPLDDRDQGLPF